MKTLKYEQVYLSEYENLADARIQIGHFLEAVYNQKRLHSSLGYLPPAEYEQQFYQQHYENRDKNQRITP
jgi:putative transposase